MRGMPSRARCSSTTPRVGPPGRRHRLLLRARQVEAGHRAEQGYQRAGSDSKLQGFGPVVTDLMAAAGELAESSDYKG